MRKVTEYIVGKFLARKSATMGNSHTDGDTLWLHGNRIAWHGSNGHCQGIHMTLAGWNTPTTRERLNGILASMEQLLRIGNMGGKPEMYSGEPTGVPLDTSVPFFVAHKEHGTGESALFVRSKHISLS